MSMIIAELGTKTRRSVFDQTNRSSGSDLVFGRRRGIGGLGSTLNWLVVDLMVEKPAHVRQGPLRVAANRDQLGSDGNGNFFRGYRSDIQANGSVHALE